jgi:hypothetical protein
LVRTEVHAIVAAADPTTITVEQCTSQCDDIFAFMDPHDEQTTDDLCATECKQ